MCKKSRSKYQKNLNLRYRVTRLHGTGRALFELGKVRRALVHIVEARIETEGSPNTHLRAKALWTEGAALGKNGIPKLEEAIDILLEPLPIDAALASLDLCKIYLENSCLSAAYHTAKSMTMFVQPFLHVPAVTKALRDLIIIGTASKGLTLTKIARIRTIITKNRTHYFQRIRRL